MTNDQVWSPAFRRLGEPDRLKPGLQTRSLVIGHWSFLGHWTLDIGHFPRRAFTLVELILVMALLAIVMAVSAPALSKFFRGRTLDSEARCFMSLTRYGQSRAVSEGVPMVLLIDTKRGTYRLQQDPGYGEADSKAVNLTLGKDLQISVEDVPFAPTHMMQGRQADPNVPQLRFQPDGFIGPTSPQTVVIREKTGETLYITQSRNRLNYEIHTSSSQNR